MNLPLLTSRSRVMLFAPHPDDESLATGVYLQRATAAGAAVRVVYATSGENNCWPQRLLERKIRLCEMDRRRWAARRQAESLAALRILGIAAENVEFLSLPDQGVTNLLLRGCKETTRRLGLALAAWRPTHLLLPSARDTHPDHSGLAVFLRLVIKDYLPLPWQITQLHYLVHGASGSFAHQASDLAHNSMERKAKRRAILCHATQVAFSRRRFLSYARRPERFVVGQEKMAPICDGPIRSFTRARGRLWLQVSFTLKPLRAEETSLYVIGHAAAGGPRRLRATLPGRSTRINLIDCASGAISSVGHYRGDAFKAEISLPLIGFAVHQPIFVKLNRFVWFFDEAGWVEIPSLVVEATATLPQLAVA
ncbi:MAG: PIG-L deacetylase family protein [Chthoniobacterales bacterium]